MDTNNVTGTFSETLANEAAAEHGPEEPNEVAFMHFALEAAVVCDLPQFLLLLRADSDEIGLSLC